MDTTRYEGEGYGETGLDTVTMEGLSQLLHGRDMGLGKVEGGSDTSHDSGEDGRGTRIRVRREWEGDGLSPTPQQ